MIKSHLTSSYDLSTLMNKLRAVEEFFYFIFNFYHENFIQNSQILFFYTLSPERASTKSVIARDCLATVASVDWTASAKGSILAAT